MSFSFIGQSNEEGEAHAFFLSFADNPAPYIRRAVKKTGRFPEKGPAPSAASVLKHHADS
ncbi:hypothetical protein CHCC20335_3797 [Bacillus paralicheniformis]|nr:hypothetical protein CHCC20335_3797 [Bacillus paralicheniformis]